MKYYYFVLYIKMVQALSSGNAFIPMYCHREFILGDEITTYEQIENLENEIRELDGDGKITIIEWKLLRKE